MQPSEYEIKREVEALRDIRRRSSSQGGPGALFLDPDLPHQSPSVSPPVGYWTAGTPALTDGDSSSSSHEDDLSTESSPNNPADDPFHLFWVPASLHPEIAPAEFRAFLKEHARAPPADGAVAPERSNSTASLGSSSLGRKRSMLSRQYKPSEHDGVEDEDKIVPLRRNRSVYANAGPQLTISDLQKLEELAEEASESDDPSKLRNILKRSLSLNMSPSVIDQMDDMPDMGDEADAPIIVPPPGQILRRTARTKIRKPGLPGDGGGHRFGASTRHGGKRSNSFGESQIGSVADPNRTSSDVSSSDHGESVDSTHRQRTFSNESMNIETRPDSFSEEASIFDSYAREDESEEDVPPSVLVVPPLSTPVNLTVTSLPPEPLVQESPVLHHPQPKRLLVPPSVPETHSIRTPSPEDSPPSRLPVSPIHEVPSFLNTPPGPLTHQRKDKDKKGLFGKWGGKSSKDKERENREREKAEKEKESGFFGSLFGSKKKQDDQSSTLIHGGTSGREAAQALLGASKSSKSYVPPPSPQFTGVGNSYARYPIHVERAIYRLSHIKLANPRRPLYEQVLISNLMFWYLGVINKAQNPGSPPSQATATNNEREQREREQKEKEERQKFERERLEKERDMEREREREKDRDREMEQKKKDPPRRGALTKPPLAGNLGGGRRAEMPVRGPQYEMQHRVMEQEYSAFNGQPSHQGQGLAHMGRAPSAPGGGVGQPLRPPVPSNYNQGLKAQPMIQVPDNFYYNGTDMTQRGSPTSPKLPPGAMPPVPVDQPQSQWLSSSQTRMSLSPPLPSASPGNGPIPVYRSRTPPPNPHIPRGYSPDNQMSAGGGGGGRAAGRSLSANAPPPMVNGKGKLRKGVSAHAALPNGGRPQVTREEEDLPLAMWQQQRRK